MKSRQAEASKTQILNSTGCTGILFGLSFLSQVSPYFTSQTQVRAKLAVRWRPKWGGSAQRLFCPALKPSALEEEEEEEEEPIPWKRPGPGPPTSGQSAVSVGASGKALSSRLVWSGSPRRFVNRRSFPVCRYFAFFADPWLNFGKCHASRSLLKGLDSKALGDWVYTLIHLSFKWKFMSAAVHVLPF